MNYIISGSDDGRIWIWNKLSLGLKINPAFSKYDPTHWWCYEWFLPFNN